MRFSIHGSYGLIRQPSFTLVHSSNLRPPGLI
jgi:hypothetical protein